MSLMEKVNTHGQTEEDIKVYGNKIKWMDLENCFMKMVEFTKENSYMIWNMVKEYTSGPMVNNMMAVGMKESNMALVSLLMLNH
jgi:hypothetical protein